LVISPYPSLEKRGLNRVSICDSPFAKGGRRGITECNTKEFIRKESLLKNLPLPLFAKEGNYSSLWLREVRRDFIINVH
jgi:hypothetical protein